MPLLTVIAIAGTPNNAAAHLVTTGLGPVYDGITHFVLSPETVLAIVAIALLGALNGRGTARACVLAALAGWLLGSVPGFWFHWSLNPMVCTAVPFLLGIGVALECKLSPEQSRWVALPAGFLLGAAQGGSLGEAGLGWRSVLGAVVPCFVLLPIVAAIAVGATREWTRTVIRVAGSWIAAMSLLMIGWLWKMGG